MSSEFETYGGLHLPAGQTPLKDWVCLSCGHEVMAHTKPDPIRWTDGHTCRFTQTDFDAQAKAACEFCVTCTTPSGVVIHGVSCPNNQPTKKEPNP